MAVLIYKIYKIINLVNGKIYVGQTTKTIEARFKKHSTADSLIGQAIRKYGKENFKLELIAECETVEEANELEMHWIKELNCKAPNGYNLTDGGEGRRGCTHSDEAREKLSIAVKQFYIDHPEAGREHSEFLKKFYEEHPEELERLANLRKGVKDTEEVKIKKAESMKKYYAEHPEASVRHSENGKKRYEDPLEREKTSAAIKKHHEEHPETRLKMAASQRARWARIRAQREQENNSKD